MEDKYTYIYFFIKNQNIRKIFFHRYPKLHNGWKVHFKIIFETRFNEELDVNMINPLKFEINAHKKSIVTIFEIFQSRYFSTRVRLY